MKKYFFFLMLINLTALGQNNYLVLLSDKNDSPYSISEPEIYLSQKAIDRRAKQNIAITEHDFPPSPQYLEAIAKTGAKIRYSSRWLNAVLVNTDSSTIKDVLNIAAVKGIYENRDLAASQATSIGTRREHIDKFSLENNLNLQETVISQLKMLGANQMHEDGFTGKDVSIAVLDAGFLNSDQLDIFENLYTTNAITSTWDFVDDETSVYEDHNHGTAVLSCIAAESPTGFVGTAPDANFYLFRTEDVFSETRTEEAYWLMAAEKADSLGVDIINTSLGYTTFDNSIQDYTSSDLNGDTALISMAADWASAAGILVVASAGNEGNGSWKYIGTPADADSVLSVAAVNSLEERTSFSSIGVPTDSRIKPEVAAQGGSTTVGTTSNTISVSNGTSFSAPLIAGFAASIMQAYPDLSAYEIRQLIIKSGNQFNSPNKLLGYGIPNYSRIKTIMLEDQLSAQQKDLIVFPNPIQAGATINGYLNTESSAITIQLFDSKGKNIKSTLSEGKFFTFEIPDSLSPNTYFIKVSTNEKTVSTSLLIY